MGGGTQFSGPPSPWRTYFAHGLSGPVIIDAMGGAMSPRPAPALDDGPIVPVRTTLRPTTYRAFAARAKELGVDVSLLLSRLADRAVQPRESSAPAVRRPRLKPEQFEAIDAEIKQLNGLGISDTQIAKMMNLAQPTVSTRRRLMGLESPSPRGGSSRAA